MKKKHKPCSYTQAPTWFRKKQIANTERDNRVAQINTNEAIKIAEQIHNMVEAMI